MNRKSFLFSRRATSNSAYLLLIVRIFQMEKLEISTILTSNGRFPDLRDWGRCRDRTLSSCGRAPAHFVMARIDGPQIRTPAIEARWHSVAVFSDLRCVHVEPGNMKELHSTYRLNQNVRPMTLRGYLRRNEKEIGENFGRQPSLPSFPPCSSRASVQDHLWLSAVVPNLSLSAWKRRSNEKRQPSPPPTATSNT